MIVLKKILNIIKRIIVLFSSLFPIKDRIIVESYLGNRNDDNIDFLLEELGDKIPIYYVQKKNNNSLHIGKRVKKNSFQYIWLYHTSAIILTNSRIHYSLLKKRKEQKIIQMWHGIPWKKLVYDQADINFSNQDKESYLERFTEDIKKWDYLWVPNEYAKEKLTSAFRYKNKYIELFYPADKKMLELNNNPNTIDNIKKKLHISSYKKIILFMPTFRENKMISSGKYEYFSTLDINSYAKNNSDYFFLCRAHYLVAEALEISENVLDVSEYSSIIDLYLVSDILMTDYSSALYSFSLLKKPIISIQFDLENYKKLRGLYNDGIKDMKITIVKNIQELNDLNVEVLQNSIPKEKYFSQDYTIEDINKILEKSC